MVRHRVEVTTVDNTSSLIGFREARAALGLSARVLNWRIERAGIEKYIDGRDRRRRLLDARDLPKLIIHEPAPRSTAPRPQRQAAT